MGSPDGHRITIKQLKNGPEKPLTISSKNYIPIQNFFATDQESKQM